MSLFHNLPGQLDHILAFRDAAQSDTLNALSIFLFWFFICTTILCVTIALVTIHRLKKRDRALAQNARPTEQASSQRSGCSSDSAVTLVAIPPKAQEAQPGKIRVETV